MPFPGGELEGERPRVLCPACRDRAGRDKAARDKAAHRPAGGGSGRPALCFQCYRLELERTRALKSAATLDTATDARFQSQLPFEPVNRARLAGLKVEREAVRTAARSGAGLYIEKRRRAQIEARHALARIVQGLRQRQVQPRQLSQESAAAVVVRSHGSSQAIEYPASWLPFVVAR